MLCFCCVVVVYIVDVVLQFSCLHCDDDDDDDDNEEGNVLEKRGG